MNIEKAESSDSVSLTNSPSSNRRHLVAIIHQPPEEVGEETRKLSPRGSINSLRSFRSDHSQTRSSSNESQLKVGESAASPCNSPRNQQRNENDQCIQQSDETEILKSVHGSRESGGFPLHLDDRPASASPNIGRRGNFSLLPSGHIPNSSSESSVTSSPHRHLPTKLFAPGVRGVRAVPKFYSAMQLNRRVSESPLHHSVSAKIGGIEKSDSHSSAGSTCSAPAAKR